jgi:hypothetical protein
MMWQAPTIENGFSEVRDIDGFPTTSRRPRNVAQLPILLIPISSKNDLQQQSSSLILGAHVLSSVLNDWTVFKSLSTASAQVEEESNTPLRSVCIQYRSTLCELESSVQPMQIYTASSS